MKSNYVDIFSTKATPLLFKKCLLRLWKTNKLETMLLTWNEYKCIWDQLFHSLPNMNDKTKRFFFVLFVNVKYLRHIKKEFKFFFITKKCFFWNRRKFIFPKISLLRYWWREKSFFFLSSTGNNFKKKGGQAFIKMSIHCLWY
jgi:hypothetical protein